jgi:uncharacterized protein YsxB (DUF464 family)
VIRASVVLDAGACLLSFKATGHAAAGDRGYDIVCAAFSTLARTAYRSLDALPGIELRGSAPEPGSLSFEVRKPAVSSERAAGIADFLIAGLGDLARDYPEAVEFELERDWKE